MRILAGIFFSLLFFQFGIAQEQTEVDTTQQQQNQAQGEQSVIDLTQLGKTYTISARMELPQVKMFDRRIKPNFKDVTANKSFENELSPQVEQIQFEPITSGKVKPIKNVDRLLKKKRF